MGPLLDYSPCFRSYGNRVGMTHCFAVCLSRNLSHPFCPASFIQRWNTGHTGILVRTFRRGRVYISQVFYARNKHSKHNAPFFTSPLFMPIQFSDPFRTVYQMPHCSDWYKAFWICILLRAEDGQSAPLNIGDLYSNLENVFWVVAVTWLKRWHKYQRFISLDFRWFQQWL